MVVDEVLRLYPSAPFVPRRIVHDSTISGYLMPANQVVSANICASHRDPRYWHRPELFNPERFAPEHPDPGVGHAYFPFGAGPASVHRQRSGPGGDLAHPRHARAALPTTTDLS